MPRIRTYLYVPYKEKEEAKQLGALWDNNKKKFYIPAYLDKNIFEKWSTQRDLKHSINQNEAIGQFKAALEAQGFIIDMPIMNGKIQRCKISGDKGNEKSGAYIGFLDEYPAGFIQNHKTGFKENWKFQFDKNNQIYRSTQSKNIDNNLLKQKQAEREAQLVLLQKKTALKLEKEWMESKIASKEHKYLISKGLKTTYDLKTDKFNNLLIPLKDENGKLWSLQRISENGDKIIGVIKTKEEKEKNIEYSARKKGCFYTQTPLENQKEFLICEGFATAMTIQNIIQKPTIMAIDAGNLINICDRLLKKYPNKKITIFADNDLKKELQNKSNTGLQCAFKCKEKYPQINIIYPQIDSKMAKKITDFNDMINILGKKETLNNINKQISNINSKEKQNKEIDI